MVITRELEGFDELIRRISLKQVPTAILSRQTGSQPLASEMGAEHYGNRSIGRVDVEIYCDNFAPLPPILEEHV